MKALIALPETDFDPTETAQPWRALKAAGHDVVFATPTGGRPACDPLLITGVIFGKLGARPDDLALYRSMENEPAWSQPITFDQIVPSEYACLVLPGGHAKGMKPYFESAVLHERIRAFVDAKKVVGAICHGVLPLARAGRAEGRRVTSLPKWMERLAYLATAWKLGDYYRTYPEYVEEEVRRLMNGSGKYERGPLTKDYDAPFVVEDDANNLVTARWPGDARAFADAIARHLRS